MNQAPQPSNQGNPHKELIDQLTVINNSVNNGRGSSTLRNIIDALTINNFADAKAITNTDFDKLRQYDDTGEIEALLIKTGLKEKLKYF